MQLSVLLELERKLHKYDFVDALWSEKFWSLISLQTVRGNSWWQNENEVEHRRKNRNRTNLMRFTRNGAGDVATFFFFSKF